MTTTLPIRAAVQALACAAVLAIAALAPTVRAEALPDGGVTADQVAAVLHDKGYVAQISKDSAGNPMIRSAAEGVAFSVHFYGCAPGSPRCASLEYAAAYHVDGGLKLTDVNAWNLKNRFGRTYLDTENDPHMEMDLGLEHGATTEAIATSVDSWDGVLASFQQMVRCASTPTTGGCAT